MSTLTTLAWSIADAHLLFAIANLPCSTGRRTENSFDRQLAFYNSQAHPGRQVTTLRDRDLIRFANRLAAYFAAASFRAIPRHCALHHVASRLHAACLAGLIATPPTSHSLLGVSQGQQRSRDP
ncbi:hypothetical protein E4U55_002890 [Claviceps digitariae]|nr:hypothetical protein E4U55_002890 [Claviceps digitariae]